MLVMLAGASACGRIGYDSFSGAPEGSGGDAPLDSDRAEASGPMGDASQDDSSLGDALSQGDAPSIDDAPSMLDGPAGDGFGSGLCSSGQCKRVFVSSATTNGGFGGVAMGDQFCQSLANGRGLGGVFKAWLSDSTANAESRVSHASVPYRLVDGTLIANDWPDLIDGNLAHAIDVCETGAPADPAHSHVWTSTTRTGRTSSNDCGSWLDGAAQASGGVGLLSSNSTTWTAVTIDACDRSDVHFYCFEQ
jgi:hypothetical protein